MFPISALSYLHIPGPPKKGYSLSCGIGNSSWVPLSISPYFTMYSKNVPPPILFYFKDIYLNVGEFFLSQELTLAIENLAFDPIVSELVWMSDAGHSLSIPVSPLSFIPATTHTRYGNCG